MSLHVLPRCLGILIVGLLLAETTHAQQVGRIGNVEASGVPYRIFAESGEATIRIYVVGGTGSAGLYEVGENTRFDEFLALAGISPPPVQPQTRQQINIRLYHQEGGERVLVMDKRVEELLRQNPNQYPLLQDGDFLQVEVRSQNKFSFRDAFQIVRTATSLVTLLRVFDVI